jgi:hypothetical protein
MFNGITTLNNFTTSLIAPITAASTTGTFANIAPMEGFGDGFRGEFRAPSTDAGENISRRGRGIFLTLIPAEGSESLDDLEIIFLYQLLNASDQQDLLFVRAQEGTTAKDWPAGTIVSARHTAGMFNDVIKKNPDGRLYLEILTTSYEYPINGADGITGFNDTVNIAASDVPCYGNDSVNIGDGGAGDTANDTAASDGMINIGRGAVYSYGDGNGSENSINIGRGGAGGKESFNIGNGGTGPFSINIGNAGAFPGAGARKEGAINFGGIGAYLPGTIAIGVYDDTGDPNSSAGPQGAGAVAIGRGSSARDVNTVALGNQAWVAPTHTNSVALGAATVTTESDQVNIGNKDLEIGDGSTQLNGRGLYLYSPDGTRYSVRVDNAGSLVVATAPLA